MLMDLGIAVALLGALLGALEVGYRIGCSARGESAASSVGQIGAILGAILGLLGLLLAFTFAAAATRFIERQDLITAEANAIGTATLRADLLGDPHRQGLRIALRDYTHHRIEVSDRLRSGVAAEELARFDQELSRIWSAAMAGVNDRPQAMLGVLPPVNDVIDLHTTRLATSRKRIPPLVIGVLAACALLAMGVLGYGAGVAKHRRAMMTVSLAVIVGATMWITYDLDHPRAGLLRLNDGPLRSLRFDE